LRAAQARGYCWPNPQTEARRGLRVDRVEVRTPRDFTRAMSAWTLRCQPLAPPAPSATE
jgi:hypothetical protein